MPLDWLRLWTEFLRLNFRKRRHTRRLLGQLASGVGTPPAPAPCQSPSDSGRAYHTHCEACLSLDRPHRYRHVCPALQLTNAGAFCTLDAAAIRPEWRRGLAGFFLPPFALAALALVLTWFGLRHGTGLENLPLADLAWPPRWQNIAEHRRAHFRGLALQALAAGDEAAASIALVSAARTGTGAGAPTENRALARLAALGGYHSLTDQLHAANLAAHPDRASELALAWHDDLLLSDRPRELARLALRQLSLPETHREFWLRAFFESLRHRGVASALLAADPPLDFPHAGLRAALAAREALERGDQLAAADRLLAFSGLPPGQAARRFLVLSWLDLGDTPRARAALLSATHPAPPGERALLAHRLLRAEGRDEEARAALRPLFAEPAMRFPVLAALIRDPDAALLREFAASIPSGGADSSPDLAWPAGLWVAARLASAPELVASASAALAAAGHSVPAQLEQAPATRADLEVSAGSLPHEREVLRALRAAP